MKKSCGAQLYGIIGTSLKHTLSPSIYDFLAKEYVVNGAYSVFEIADSDLPGTIKAMRLLRIKGLNVTYPFKEKIIKYLDKIDAGAADIGAVNTVKNVNGVLTGYNTDRFGIEATFSRRLMISPRKKNVLIIGAGGAARACLGALMHSAPDTIVIINRTSAKAKMLKRNFAEKFNKTRFIAGSIENNAKITAKMKFDIIINAITTDKTCTGKVLHLLSESKLLDETRFFDMNYGHRALSDALPEGINCQADGLYMLAAQAARSFQIWHNKEVDTDRIFNFLNSKQ